MDKIACDGISGKVWE